jgi:hypothetical protein
MSMVHSGGYITWSSITATAVPPVVSMWKSISIKMPSLWDFHCKRPVGPKYISPRCQPWVEQGTTKVPEAQDDFMEERAFASGMETDDLVAEPFANAPRICLHPSAGSCKY